MRALLLMGLACSLLGGGCGSAARGNSGGPAKLTTARVDTAIILQNDPDYQKNAEAYLQEQLDLEGKFFGKFKTARSEHDDAKKKEIAAAYNDARTKLEEKWRKKTTDFLTSRHDKLRGAAEQVAKDMKIELVVVDSKEYPSVEYGAVDITQEVMLRMSGADNKTPGPGPQETKK